MAKHLVFDYTFDASAKTVTLDGIYAQKRFLLITNVNDNEIVYSFNDPSKGLSDISFDYTNYTTTITLAYDTTSMADTDPLQIFVEADAGTVKLDDPYLDPVSKLRVSNPENLIDTDFEYGLQSTKWETLELTKNIPTFFARNGDDEIELTNITTQEDSDIITVTTLDAHGFQRGSPLIMIGTSTITADGGFVVASVIDDNTFTYKCKGVQPLNTTIKETYTQLFPGSVYSGTEFKLANIGGITTDAASPSTLTVNTEYPTAFSDNTSMVLSNTFAKTSIEFNTDNVEPNNSTTYSLTRANNTATGETDNFPIGGVNGIGFKGLQDALYFDLSAVTVSTINNTIDFGVAHNFTTNQGVAFFLETGTNTMIGGLTSNRGYFVEAVNSTTIRLYRNRGSSFPTSVVSLTSTGASGGISRGLFCSAYQVIGPNGPRTGHVLDRNHNFNPSIRTRLLYVRSFAGNTTPYFNEFTNIFSPPQNFDYWGGVLDATTVRPFTTETGNSTPFIWFNTNWFFVPIESTNNEAENSFYAPNHGLSPGGAITIGSTAGTLPSGAPAGTYLIDSVTQNRISLKSTSGVSTNFATNGSSSLTYTLGATSQLQDADSVTVANFEVSDGDPITYLENGGTTIGGLTDGTTYYVARKTGDRFNLSTSTNYIAAEYSIPNQASTTYVDISGEFIRLSPNTTGLSTGDTVEYVSNNPIAGLSSGSLYFVRVLSSINIALYPTAADAVADTNRIDLIARSSGTGTIRQTNIVDITSTPSGETQIFQLDFVGAADGIYPVGSTADDQLSFTLTANSQISPRTFSATIQATFEEDLNGFYYEDHGFITGDSATITLAGTEHLNGITSGNTYYLIRVSKDFFQLASSASDALDGTAISITSSAASTAQSGTLSIAVSSVVGSFAGQGTVSYAASSNYVIGDGTKFTSYFNAGDTFRINIPPTITTTTNAITSINTTTDVFVITAHGLSDGDAVYFTGDILPTGIVDGYLYYVNTTITGDATNRIMLFYTKASAVSGTSGDRVSLTDVGTNVRANKFDDAGEVVERTIDYVNSDFKMTFTSDLPATAQTSVQYFLSTQLLLRSDGFALHRPYDGGVELIPSTNPDSQMIRQTRKYFRYQSGKGIQVSFAVNFSPTTQIDEFSRSGTTGTITTRFPHRLSAGLTVVTSGSTNTDQDAIGTKTYDVEVVTDTFGNSVFQIQPFDASADITLYEGRTYRFDQSDASNSGYQLLFSTTDDGDNNGGVEYTTGVTKSGTPGTAGAYTEITVAASAPTLYAYVSGTAGVGFTAPTPVDPDNGVANLWNGELEVLSVVDDSTFTVELPGTPSDAEATGSVEFYVKSWTNSSLRCGLYDDQNGIFFEFDGQTLYVCRRSSIRQISGYASCEFRSGIVNGSGTKFQSQLALGDQIVIKGQTHVVTKINSDTQIAISPSYRGVTADKIIITKTETTRVPQNQWNLDVCDGTGHTGFDLNIYRIQMAYIDYSWYGAGKVRFGFKDQNGDVKYVHQFVHGNFFTEAYMRSGNLPARYEIQNNGAPSYVPALAHWGTSIIMDGRYDNDRAYVFNAASNNITLTGEATLTVQAKVDFTGIYTQRRFNRNYSAGYAILLDAPDGNLNSVGPGTSISGANLPVGTTAANPTSTFVSPYQPYLPSILSREGTASSTEDTRSLLLVDTQPSGTSGTSTTYTIGTGVSQPVTGSFPLISVRLAPSVDTSTPGVLGEREIINRMQLILDQVSILTTHTAEISLVLNGQLSTNAWQRVNNPSLSQLLVHTNEDTITGGASVYNFRASGDTGTTNRVQQLTTESLGEVATLGNSILGGDNTFPDGPDVLTVVATLTEDPSTVSSSNPFVVTGRISWSESQA